LACVEEHKEHNGRLLSLTKNKNKDANEYTVLFEIKSELKTKNKFKTKNILCWFSTQFKNIMIFTV